MSLGLLTPELESLAASWRLRAQELRTWGAFGNAETLERAATELTASLDSMAGELVTLEQAAELSGYNADSLRRMVREKKLHAVRRGRRLYFRAGDLPRKPVDQAFGVDAPHLVGYDPLADARMVARRRRHGE